MVGGNSLRNINAGEEIKWIKDEERGVARGRAEQGDAKVESAVVDGLDLSMKEGKSLPAGEEVTREGQEGSVIITALEKLQPGGAGPKRGGGRDCQLWSSAQDGS